MKKSKPPVVKGVFDKRQLSVAPPLPPPDHNAELELLRRRLSNLRGASPSFEELMQAWRDKSAELSKLEMQIMSLYPDKCPRCSYCDEPFSEGYRCGGCGGS